MSSTVSEPTNNSDNRFSSSKEETILANTALPSADPSDLSPDRIELVKALIGVIPPDITPEDAKAERLNKICSEQQ